MRIRKHAKISPLVYATSSLNPATHLHTHFCQLNQSPWDVMNFSPPSTPPPPPPPPPPPQVHGDGAFAVNGSLRDCISVTKRDQCEYSGGIPAKSTTVKAEEPPPVAAAAKERIIFCCKTDGKSWQCKNEAAKGNSLCEHHISQARSYNNGYHYMAKKHEKLSSESRRPARTKKASTSSNPYDFYYYSGFGPRWGKNRGEALSITSATAAADTATDSNNNGSSSKNVEHEDEMGDDESDSDEFEEEEEIKYTDKNIGKKRVRKPIKARSLKSLM